MSEPRLTEATITASTGGAVQIVKFNLRNDFGLTYAETYTIPDDWTSEQVDQWRATATEAIKAKVDAHAQAEQDALLAASDWYE